MTIFQAALFAIEQLFEKEYKPVPIFVSNNENKMCGNFSDYSYRQTWLHLSLTHAIIDIKYFILLTVEVWLKGLTCLWQLFVAYFGSPYL